jgi:hypothetical protein
MSAQITLSVLILASVLFLGLVYRRARGELRAWQGWGTALCCGWLLALPLFLPDVLRASWVPLSLSGISSLDPLEGLSAVGSWFLGSAIAGLGVAICATILADTLVSLAGLEPARSSELAQEVQALREQGTVGADTRRRLQREFFVADRTLEALLED